MRVLAIDPDTTTTGWSIVEMEPTARRSRVVRAGLVKSPRALKGDEGVLAQIRACFGEIPWCSTGLDAIVVEGQYFTKGSTHAESLYKVAWVTGAVCALAMPWTSEVHIISPQLWTRSTSKDQRIAKFERHWFDTTQLEVQQLAGCAPGEVNHVLDSAGIGRWYIMNHKSVTWTQRNRKR